MIRNKTAVIGLGNYLLADEGVGMHAVEILRKRDYSGGVDFVDAGTPGMNLLHQFEQRERIIFIDSGECGLKPGKYARFKPEEVVSLKKTKNYSLHEFDLISFIEKADELGATKNTNIIVYCMQAGEIKMSRELSSDVQKGLPGMVDEIFSEIEGELTNA
ncbi:MAG: hydrogenase maturation protease [Candidatus Aminicenantes bacterium]|nr:hydrogenase maturation protease [Candidatus Aminicenantes bacterium]